MKNLPLLISNNSVSAPMKLLVENRCFVFRRINQNIDSKTIFEMIRFIATLTVKYTGMRLPIVFELKKCSFQDKLTYVLFECLCEYLTEECGHRVVVSLPDGKHIHTAGLRYSPLLCLSNHTEKNADAFKRKFSFDILQYHFRKVLLAENCEPTYLSKLFQDVDDFQKNCGVDGECREKISEVIAELVGNAVEHGDGNCLVDFDIAPNFIKNGSNEEFIGINIVVMNFSSKSLGEALKDKILYEEDLGSRYAVVKSAYEKHRGYFEDEYTQEDFFNLMVFQDKISGRGDSLLGGRGLTKLIESLEKRSDAHMCYVVSNGRILLFSPEYLNYNKGMWLGFNKENNIFEKPAPEITGTFDFVFPGTAYNLNFVMQKEN